MVYPLIAVNASITKMVYSNACQLLCQNGHAVHFSHQFFVEVTNQMTNYKSPIFLFQVTKMCCMIKLQLRIETIYRNLIEQHILVT